MFLKNCIKNKMVKSPQRISKIRYLMNTFFEIEVLCERYSSIIEIAFGEIKRLERLLSRFQNESEISLVNCAAGNSPIKVSDETLNLIKSSLKFSSITDGGFNITICPLVELWKLAEEKNGVPTEEEIKNVISLIDFKEIEVEEVKKTVFLKKKGMKIDLGAIGKGYAVDRAIKILKENGITQAMVNAGGNLYILGEHIGGNPSSIGIPNPLKPDEIIAKIDLTDRAISTSGNYERFFTIDGRQFGHIINPVTGYPENRVLSVSIVADTAIKADALSTGILVMGFERGMKLIESLNNVEGIIITNNKEDGMQIDISEGLKGKGISKYV